MTHAEQPHDQCPTDEPAADADAAERRLAGVDTVRIDPSTLASDISASGTCAADASEADACEVDNSEFVASSEVDNSDDWRSSAACRGETRLFFPPKAERPQARARREAKALRLCADCPVQHPCQEFARQHREYGFWAGESEEERHLAGFTVAAPIGIRARDAGKPSELRKQHG